jgi:DNA polymerase-3 subunit epsilon
MNLMEMLGLGESGPVELSQDQLIRLAAWRDRAAVDSGLAHAKQRYVIVDVEASGLDLANDSLLAIGAVQIDQGLIDSAQVFESALTASGQPPEVLPAPAVSRTRQPLPAADALLGFLEFAGKSVLVAHRADFPRTLLERAIRHHLGVAFEPLWLDLAYILPGLFEGGPDVTASLAKWQLHFSITNPAPHHAVADAYVVARLMQRVIARAIAGGLATPGSLGELEQMRRRVQRSF